MMKPTVWHLICRDAHDWRLEQHGELLTRFDHKDDAIRDAMWRAQQLDGAQLIIHHPDGSVERELHLGTRSAG